MRLELLDEIVFEQEGVFFGLDHGVLQRIDVLHKRPGLAVELLGRPEILRNAALEIFRLADINHGAARIQIAVNTWIVGEFSYFLSDIHRKIVPLYF